MIPLLNTILSQMNPIHTFKPYLFKIYFNIISPSKPRRKESVSKTRVMQQLGLEHTDPLVSYEMKQSSLLHIFIPFNYLYRYVFLDR